MSIASAWATVTINQTYVYKTDKKRTSDEWVLTARDSSQGMRRNSSCHGGSFATVNCKVATRAGNLGGDIGTISLSHLERDW